MGILEALARLQVQFIRHHRNLMTLLRVRVAYAEKSEDARLLNGIDLTDLLGPAKDALAAHALRTDNPHNDRAESLKLNTRAQFDAKMGTMIPQGVVPVSSFGEMDPGLDLTKAFSRSGWTFSSLVPIKAVVAGNSYVLKSQTVDLSASLTNYTNKTVLVYLKLRQGVISYTVSLIPLAESNTVLFIGTLTTSDSAITALNLEKVIRIGTFRPYGQPRGSVIPYAAGTRSAPTKLPANWKPS